jgi:UPF0755 protein
MIDTQTTETTDEIVDEKPIRFFRLWYVFFLLPILLLGGLFLYTENQVRPPTNFPIESTFKVESGEPLKTIADRLEEEGYVKSSFLLYLSVLLFHDPTEIKASSYYFDRPIDTFEFAERLTEGDYDNDLIRFTHIEGETNVSLAERAAEVLSDFDGDLFLNLASTSEGRLFPDTYFIPADFNEEELFLLLIDSYEENLADYVDLLESDALTEEEVIILASIIEREANTPQSMELVAGILRNRLDAGMPLQADATIEYVLDTPLGELREGELAEELRETDSPYNTYKYAGLPPTPIGNPGRTAIEAALSPTDSDYFFYITGNDGEFYYAETYDEHLRNIELHLR